MSGEFDRNLKACLRQQAEEVPVSEAWSRQVLRQVRAGAEQKNEEGMFMRHKRVKVLAICAAVCCLGVGSAFAAGNGSIAYVNGGTGPVQIRSYEKLEKKLASREGNWKAVEAFSNGFTFTGASTGQDEGVDTDGNTIYKVQTISINYQSGAKKVNLVIRPHMEESTGTSLTVKEVNGIRFQYSCQRYKVVPEDGGDYLTEQDRKDVEAGKLKISYGDDVEYTTHYCVMWVDDGMDYSISGLDVGLDAETMFEMAEEVAFGR